MKILKNECYFCGSEEVITREVENEEGLYIVRDVCPVCNKTLDYDRIKIKDKKTGVYVYATEYSLEKYHKAMVCAVGVQIPKLIPIVENLINFSLLGWKFRLTPDEKNVEVQFYVVRKS